MVSAVDRFSVMAYGVLNKPLAISETLLFCWYVKFVVARARVPGLPAVWAARYDCAADRRPARVHSAVAADVSESIAATAVVHEKLIMSTFFLSRKL